MKIMLDRVKGTEERFEETSFEDLKDIPYWFRLDFKDHKQNSFSRRVTKSELRRIMKQPGIETIYLAPAEMPLAGKYYDRRAS